MPRGYYVLKEDFCRQVFMGVIPAELVPILLKQYLVDYFIDCSL